jgi:hypothetical protein
MRNLEDVRSDLSKGLVSHCQTAWSLESKPRRDARGLRTEINALSFEYQRIQIRKNFEAGPIGPKNAFCFKIFLAVTIPQTPLGDHVGNRLISTSSRPLLGKYGGQYIRNLSLSSIFWISEP